MRIYVISRNSWHWGKDRNRKPLTLNIKVAVNSNLYAYFRHNLYYSLFGLWMAAQLRRTARRQMANASKVTEISSKRHNISLMCGFFAFKHIINKFCICDDAATDPRRLWIHSPPKLNRNAIVIHKYSQFAEKARINNNFDMLSFLSRTLHHTLTDKHQHFSFRSHRRRWMWP